MSVEVKMTKSVDQSLQYLRTYLLFHEPLLHPGDEALVLTGHGVHLVVELAHLPLHGHLAGTELLQQLQLSLQSRHLGGGGGAECITSSCMYIRTYVHVVFQFFQHMYVCTYIHAYVCVYVHMYI